MSTEILAIWQSFVFSPYFSDIKLQRYSGHDFDLLGSRDVMCHVTTGFSMCGFLLVVNMNWPCISHGCRDIELQRYLGHDLDLMGSRDVTSSVTWPLHSQYRVSYRWSICTDRLSRTVFWDIKLQRSWLWPFGVQPMLKAKKLTAHASYHVTCR